MSIKTCVNQLIDEFHTSCPFTLAHLLNIHVLFFDLHEEIRGYYKYDRRNKYIVINNNLDSNSQRLVCSHELGHAILHPLVNTPFMRKHTLFSVDKIEIEANTFAAYLLIPDESLFDSYDQMSIYDIAALHYVPVELAELKYKGLF